MKRGAIVLFWVLAFAGIDVFAACPYYVQFDNTVADGTRDGTAAKPWKSLVDAGATAPPWNVLNGSGALGTSDCTVYFAARKQSADQDNLSTVTIPITRADTSTHVLMLDGKSKYNTSLNSDGWMNYSGTSRARIRASGSAAIESQFCACAYIHINGFHLQSSGKLASLVGISNLTFENTEGYVFDGVGYSVASNVPVTGCPSGTGFTINILSVDDLGGITTWSMNTPGTGYQDEVPGCLVNQGGNTTASILPLVFPTSPGPVSLFRIDSVGPGVTIGSSCNYTCTDYPHHIVLQGNFIHNTFGEGFYIGGVTPDPPGPEGFGYQTANGVGSSGGHGTGLTFNIIAGNGGQPCTDLNTGNVSCWTVANQGMNYQVGDIILITYNKGSTPIPDRRPANLEVMQVDVTTGAVLLLSQQNAGDDILIQQNTLSDCGTWGGDNDCIDVKESNTNVNIRNNTIYYTSTNIAFNENCQSMTIEAARVIDGNFVWQDPAANCAGYIINIADSWNSSIGREGLDIRNNILIGNGKGKGLAVNNSNYIGCTPFCAPFWEYLNIENNTLYNAGTISLSLENSSLVGKTVNVQNNLVINTNGGVASPCPSGSCYDFIASPGGAPTYTLNLGHNNFWRSAAGIQIVRFDLTNHFWGFTSCPSGSDCYTMVEPTATNSNPLFVSTAQPFFATNFELGMGSPAAGTAGNLSTTFTDDFCNNTRQTSPTAWDKGAWINSPGMTTNCAGSTLDALVFAVQPTNIASGGTFSPAFEVDATIGGVIDTGFTGTITVNFNPCGSSLTGSASLAATAGRAVFTGRGAITMSTACAFTATSPNTIAATSNLFDVIGNPPPPPQNASANPRGFFLVP